MKTGSPSFNFPNSRRPKCIPMQGDSPVFLNNLYFLSVFSGSSSGFLKAVSGSIFTNGHLRKINLIQ